MFHNIQTMSTILSISNRYAVDIATVGYLENN